MNAPNNAAEPRPFLSDQPTRTLPHRDPFLWVSRLVSRAEDGSHGVVELDVREDLPLFAGHFPGQPIFPGVLQVEGAAQACLWAHMGELAPGATLPQVLFVGVDSYKFRRPVVPPATLSFHVRQEKVRAGLQLWSVEVKIDAQLVSGGTFWLKMVARHEAEAKPSGV